MPLSEDEQRILRQIEAELEQAELLTDARRLRGLHGDQIVVAPSGSPEHELHVNLHACERSALAAQRRGVEALTARLRSDDALLASISDAAMLANIALRWLEVRFSLRPVLP